MSRRTQKRKNGGGRFARLPKSVMDHAAVETLTHVPFRVLMLMALEFTGYNNGKLGVTRGQAARHGISHTSLYRALRTLEERGLIGRTYHASRVPPRPTMYALAWMAVDDTEYSTATRLPSHAYREWTPKPKPKRKRRKKTRLKIVK